MFQEGSKHLQSRKTASRSLKETLLCSSNSIVIICFVVGYLAVQYCLLFAFVEALARVYIYIYMYIHLVSTVVFSFLFS